MQPIPNQSQTNFTVFETDQDFMNYLGKAVYIENPLVELANSPTALVYYGAKCCTLRCCVPCHCICDCICDCADYYKYNTFIINNLGQQKYLFKNIAKLKCNICCTDVYNRLEYCKDFSMASFDQFKTDSGIETAEMINESDCILFGICEGVF